MPKLVLQIIYVFIISAKSPMLMAVISKGFCKNLANQEQFTDYTSKFIQQASLMFFINKMIATSNLPFHQDYFSNSQNLQNLRSSINSLISNDIQSLQSLLTVVSNTLQSPQVFTNDQAFSETYKKQKELQLFKYLSEQNRDRSDTVTGLAQIITKMIDFIEEEHQKNESLICSYKRKIDQLTETINQMAYNKTLIENDIQILKQQLQCAQFEIDKLIEERNYFNQNQLVSSELKEQLHNFKIQLLQNQLNKLKNALNLFNNTHKQSKTSLACPQQRNTLKYNYSLDHFAFPKGCNLFTEVTNKRLPKDDNTLIQPSYKEKKQSIFLKEHNYATKANKSPKKGVRYLTEHSKSQENIDEDQLKSIELWKDNYQIHQKSFQKLSCYKKDSFIQLKQLNINSNSEENQKFHRLCSDFSHKSFTYQILPQVQQTTVASKLIYITEDDNQNKSNSSRKNLEFNFSNLTSSLETKESQLSIKDTPKTNLSATIKFQNKSMLGKPFMFKSTVLQKSNSNLMYSSSVLQKQRTKVEKEQSKGFCQFLSNFIVKNRVKRISQKANSGFNKFLI